MWPLLLEDIQTTQEMCFFFLGSASQLSSNSLLINSRSLLHSVVLMSTDGVGHLPQTPISEIHQPSTSVKTLSFHHGGALKRSSCSFPPHTGQVKHSHQAHLSERVTRSCWWCVLRVQSMGGWHCEDWGALDDRCLIFYSERDWLLCLICLFKGTVKEWTFSLSFLAVFSYIFCFVFQIPLYPKYFLTRK